mmetsp:Transcript_9972/g.29322  ORF Transcript_9972/g.29322 Transcript_9972/m.29322 type:complete len:228 (+) Transcript_9972:596-1279(+)
MRWRSRGPAARRKRASAAGESRRSPRSTRTRRPLRPDSAALKTLACSRSARSSSTLRAMTRLLARAKGCTPRASEASRSSLARREKGAARREKTPGARPPAVAAPRSETRRGAHASPAPAASCAPTSVGVTREGLFSESVRLATATSCAAGASAAATGGAFPPAGLNGEATQSQTERAARSNHESPSSPSPRRSPARRPAARAADAPAGSRDGGCASVRTKKPTISP